MRLATFLGRRRARRSARPSEIRLPVRARLSARTRAIQASRQERGDLRARVVSGGPKGWPIFRFISAHQFIQSRHHLFMQSALRTSSTEPARKIWAGAYYRQQRDKGSSYQAAVRSLAFEWIRILYRCWQTNTPYDESRYLNALRKRRSPLLKNLELNAKNT